MRIPKLAVVASILTEAPREAPRDARLAGWEGLQFDAYSSALRLPDLSQTGRREFLHLLSAEGRQLVGLRADVGPAGFGPGADVDRLIDGLNRAMEAAVALGAPLLCVEVGPMPSAPVEIKAKPRIAPQQAGLILLPENDVPAAAPPPAVPPPDPAFVSQVDSALAELGRRADRYSAILAFRSDLAGFAALERAIKSANCPWFGIDLDPVALLRDEWTRGEIFSRLGPLIRHVRGRDASRGADRRTKPAIIGQGSTNWAELFANLDDADYSGWLTLDSFELTHRGAAAQAGAEYLRGL